MNNVDAKNKRIGVMILLPILAGALWGTVPVFVRILTAFGMSNLTILFTRVVTGSLLLFIFLFFKDKSLLKIKPGDIWLFLGCGVLGMLTLNYCYTEAINHLSVSFAAVLISLCPVMVMFLAAFFLHEKITVKKVVCALAAFAGCFLVSGLIEGGKADFSAWGITAGLLSALFYAVYTIISKILTQKRYSVFTIIFYCMLVTAVALIPVADMDVIGSYIDQAPAPHTAFLILQALCGSILPYVLYTLAFKWVEAGTTSILAAGAEPSAAMLFGLLFFAEIPTPLMITGLGITIAAIAVLCREREPRD